MLSFASSTTARERCPAAPRTHVVFGDLFGAFAAGSSPVVHEHQQREQEATATYQALLAAGAPEPMACAAALNPDVRCRMRAGRACL